MPGFGCEDRNGVGSGLDRFRLQTACQIKTAAKPGLFAFLGDGNDFTVVDFSQKQFDRIGADINGGTEFLSNSHFAPSFLVFRVFSGYGLVIFWASTAAPVMQASSAALLATIWMPLIVPFKA